ELKIPNQKVTQKYARTFGRKIAARELAVHARGYLHAQMTPGLSSIPRWSSVRHHDERLVRPGVCSVTNRPGFRPSHCLGLRQTRRRPLVQHPRTLSERQPSPTAAPDGLCEYGSRPLEVASIKKLVRFFTVLRPAFDLVKRVRQQRRL